jgi:predicted LPLAT superfamily acyltransferase
MKEAGALNGLRFMVSVYSILGRAVFNVVLAPVMVYFFLRRGSARRASMDYLRKVKRSYPERFGNQSLCWLSYRHFLSFGRSLLDKYLARVKKPTDIEMDSAQEKTLLGYLSSGQGGLFIGSHFGNLEYSRGLHKRHPDMVMNILMYDQHAENFSALTEAAKSESRLTIFQVTEIDFELALVLKEKVKRGEWVVIAGDRVPVGEGKRVCTATFFGDKANLPVGPYVLANLLRCPVYLLHCFQVEDHHHVGVEFFAQEFRSERKNRQEAYEGAAQKFALALEKQVARFPLQWFNFFDFWQIQKQALMNPRIRDNYILNPKHRENHDQT